MKELFIGLAGYVVALVIRWYWRREDPERLIGEDASAIRWAMSGEYPFLIYCSWYLVSGAFNYWLIGPPGVLTWVLIFVHVTTVSIGHRRMLDEQVEPNAYYDKAAFLKT